MNSNIYYFFVFFVIIGLWVLWYDYYIFNQNLEEYWATITEEDMWLISVEPTYDIVSAKKLTINVNEILFYQKYFDKFKTLNCSAYEWNPKLQRNYIIDLSTYQLNKFYK